MRRAKRPLLTAGVPGGVDAPASAPGWGAGRVAGTIAAGVAAGMLTDMAAAVPVLHNLTTFGGPWVCGAVTIGYFSRTPRRASVIASLFLLSMLGAFYATRAMTVGGGQSRFLLFWTVLALVAGPIFGTLGAIAQRGNWGGAAAAAVVAGYLMGEAIAITVSVRDPARAGIITADMLAGIAALMFLPASGYWRLRAGLLLPIPLLGGALVLVVVRLLARAGGL